MKIVVAVKQVAALDEEFELLGDGSGVDDDFIEWELNADCRRRARGGAGGEGRDRAARAADNPDGNQRAPVRDLARDQAGAREAARASGSRGVGARLRRACGLRRGTKNCSAGARS